MVPWLGIFILALPLGLIRMIQQPMQTVFVFWGITTSVDKRPKLGDGHRIAHDGITRKRSSPCACSSDRVKSM